MVTKEQACWAGSYFGHVEFEYLHETYSRSKQLKRVRVSGKCKTWKTRPDEFKLPVKYGMYESLYITERNAADYQLTPVYQSMYTDSLIKTGNNLLQRGKEILSRNPSRIHYHVQAQSYGDSKWNTIATFGLKLKTRAFEYARALHRKDPLHDIRVIQK